MNISGLTSPGSPPTSFTPSFQVDFSHMPANFSDYDSPWWDKTDPNVFYYGCGNSICKGTITGVNTTTNVTLHTFSAYAEAGQMAIPGYAYDGTTINLVGAPSSGSYQIFSFNMATQAIGDSVTLPCASSGTLGPQPAGGGMHKLQESADGHLMLDLNTGGTCTQGANNQYLSNGSTLHLVWPAGGTAHHLGIEVAGGTPVWLAIGSAGGTNPCGAGVGAVYILDSDIFAGSPPFTNHCFFADYYTGGDSHLSGESASNPWVAFSMEDGGSSNSNCEFYYSANPSYCNPTTNCSYGNNVCSTKGAWTTYQSELDLVPTDYVGSTTGAGGSPGATGRSAWRLIYLYQRSLQSFGEQAQCNSSGDGRWIACGYGLGVTAGACSASTGTGSCPNVYVTGPLFSAGSSPAVSLSPSSLSFGNQNVSTTSAQQVVTLTNTGTASLTISSVALTTGTQFALATPGSGSDCRTVGTVAASASCNIAVTFTPTSAGAQSDTVSVTDNASGSPHTFGVSGTGITSSPTVAPVAVMFSGNFKFSGAAMDACRFTCIENPN